MYTVSDYRADILTIVGDPTGRRYSENILDMGLKEALEAYRTYCPLQQVISCTVEAIENNVVSFAWLYSPADDIISIKRPKTGVYIRTNPYFEQGKLRFYTPDAVYIAIGEELLVTINGRHQIKGLSGSNVTTVPDSHAMVLAAGAAGYAMRIRARSVTEVFGKRPEDREALSSQANRLLADYNKELLRIQTAVYDPMPRGDFPI